MAAAVAAAGTGKPSVRLCYVTDCGVADWGVGTVAAAADAAAFAGDWHDDADADADDDVAQADAVAARPSSVWIRVVSARSHNDPNRSVRTLTAESSRQHTTRKPTINTTSTTTSTTTTDTNV